MPFPAFTDREKQILNNTMKQASNGAYPPSQKASQPSKPQGVSFLTDRENQIMDNAIKQMRDWHD